MKKIILTLTLSMLFFSGFAQIGIGTTTPNASSALDITSTNRGLLIPRMTQVQKNAITTPATGLLIYQTDGASGFWFYNGASWQPFSSGSGWSLSGNSGTTPATNKLGTTDNQSLVLRANNVEVSRILGNRDVGIGTSTPTAKLHVTSNSSTFFFDGFEDNTLPPFTTGGNANWATQNTTVNSGTRASRSGAIGHSQSSWMEYSTTLPSNASISFYFNTSTESCCDRLRFYIDGVQQNNWGGTTSWTFVSFPVASGTHTFRWEYTKDGSVVSGADQVYIDDITISIPNPVLTIQDGNQAAGRVLISDANGNGVWTNPASLAIADDDWRFASGSTTNDPIYRTGYVGVGNTYTPYGLLDVEEPTYAGEGTQFGIGNNEYFQDRQSEHTLSHNVVPRVNNSISLGSAALRWSTVYATNGTINTSDKREKEAIKPLQYGTSDLMKLKPVSYQWKEEKYGNTIVTEKDKQNKIGFIAQDLLEVMPEVVQTENWREIDGNYQLVPMERLGVNYAEILPAVIKTTQEQQVLINNIKEKQKEIETILTELK